MRYIQKANLLLYMAVELRRDRISGFGLDKSRISSKVFECLKMLDDFYDAFERNLQIEHKKYLEAMLKKPSL